MSEEQMSLNFDGQQDDAGRLQREFNEWAHTPGGRHVCAEAYRRTAPYAGRYIRSRRHVSFSLIWEIMRDRIEVIRDRCKRRGIDFQKWDGYSLPNNMRAYLSRHIMAHRPEWDGLFVTAELRSKRSE